MVSMESIDYSKLNHNLRSPSMVAAVLASTPRPYGYPPRDTVRRCRKIFERVASESNLNSCFLSKERLVRGRSYDVSRYRKENEAQRLVKYRSVSSLSSFDSGIGNSRHSLNGSPPLRRSESSDYFGKGIGHNHLRLSFSCQRLPDLLPSPPPPPLPPKTKKRPTLPPRRQENDPPSLPPRLHNFCETESDDNFSSNSDSSLQEYFLHPDEENSDSELCRGIPNSFPFKCSFQKFLNDLSRQSGRDFVIKDVCESSFGYLNLRAFTDSSWNEKISTSSSDSENGDSKKYFLPKKSELQIFFRTGTISRLEEQRDLVLTDTVIRLQAVCRGVLARRRLNKRKVQELAIRCIQKNVKKFMAVRDWPWWRLLVRVTPLLNVHRTEEELKSTKDELETLRNRLEKSDKERADLKHDNDKLEARVSNLAS